MTTVFFQALSAVLHGHQDKHQEVWNQLVQFITLHRKFVFSAAYERAFEKND